MAQYAPDTVLARLDAILKDRRDADPSSSYAAKLHAGGPELIGKKVGEEATELAMAGVLEDTNGIVNETADLWFHSMVLLSHHGLDSAAVLAELARRFGVSGIDEKASRTAGAASAAQANRG